MKFQFLIFCSYQGLFTSVWPYLGIEKEPNLSKKSPKNSQSSFCLISDVFKISPKSCQLFEQLLWVNWYSQELLKYPNSVTLVSINDIIVRLIVPSHESANQFWSLLLYQFFLGSTQSLIMENRKSYSALGFEPQPASKGRLLYKCALGRLLVTFSAKLLSSQLLTLCVCNWIKPGLH